MKLSTSNPNKIKEFKEILWDKIEIVKWKDLKEVDWNSREVIIYKSLDAWEDFVVEDTIVEIEWKEVVDIKWKIEELENLKWKKISWITRLWYNFWEYIYIYTWRIDWTISEKRWNSWFAFDPFFVPNWEIRTLAELADISLEEKNKFSARKKVLIKLLENNYDEKILKNSIPKWTWKYQND